MKFSSNHYSKLKNSLARRYKSHLKKITTKAKESDLLSAEWFCENLEFFSEYSSINWYFLNHLSTILFLEGHEFNSEDSDIFNEEDEQVFEIWNQSEFTDIFLKSMNKTSSLEMSSRVTIPIYDAHLIALGKIHVTKEINFSSDYRPQISLGEILKSKKYFKLLETTLHFNGKEIKLLSHSLKEMKDFSNRIDSALKLIRLYSPSSWDRFSAFTDVIVPIKQAEFVSYSQQDYPGVSMINLYDRDFIDLLDDLLHENGHHHLNYYLNLEVLIEEPLEQIYYSPWRRTPRPLRGIYHAYFTFFWAFKLFADILDSKAESELYMFNKTEMNKIRFRAIEEFYMLDYSFKDLKWARKKKLIHDEGWELIEAQQLILKKYKTKIKAWEKDLKSNKAELTQLKKTLASAEKKYLKTR